jgi:hypothetical protein
MYTVHIYNQKNILPIIMDKHFPVERKREKKRIVLASD